MESLIARHLVYKFLKSLLKTAIALTPLSWCRTTNMYMLISYWPKCMKAKQPLPRSKSWTRSILSQIKVWHSLIFRPNLQSNPVKSLTCPGPPNCPPNWSPYLGPPPPPGPPGPPWGPGPISVTYPGPPNCPPNWSPYPGPPPPPGPPGPPWGPGPPGPPGPGPPGPPPCWKETKDQVSLIKWLTVQIVFLQLSSITWRTV